MKLILGFEFHHQQHLHQGLVLQMISQERWGSFWEGEGISLGIITGLACQAIQSPNSPNFIVHREIFIQMSYLTLSPLLVSDFLSLLSNGYCYNSTYHIKCSGVLLDPGVQAQILSRSGHQFKINSLLCLQHLQMGTISDVT